MKYKEENFVLNIENNDSPIIIAVPHGGMRNDYGSWFDLFFKQRSISENKDENFIDGEKKSIVEDNQIMQIVANILKTYQANAVIGLLPRLFVDYNRFIPKVAYSDENIKPFYKVYHQNISDLVEKTKKKWGGAILFDFHGFGKQPIEGEEFDVVVGTNGESSPHNIDKYLYTSLKDKYKIFCAGTSEIPMYKGDTTNLFYHKKYGIDAMLIEIAPKFRYPKLEDSKILGEKLAQDFADFFHKLDKKIKEIK